MNMTLNQHARFWDGIARKYSQQKISDPDGYARTLSRTGAYLNATDRVLELGCGTGTTALKLVGSVAQYTATDVSPEMIAIGQSKAEGVENLTFVVSGSLVETVGEGPWNAVMAFNLLHLVPDLDATLKRASDLLESGGLLITKTPCLAPDWYLRPIVKVMQLFGKAPPVTFFADAELDAKITAAGFELVEVDEHNKSTRGHFVVARKR